jgi:RNA polymerase subunit RPABC4/transcription elongation factor Spt4
VGEHRFCTSCGKQISVQSRFCQNCGEPVRQASEEPVQMSPQGRQIAKELAAIENRLHAIQVMDAVMETVRALWKADLEAIQIAEAEGSTADVERTFDDGWEFRMAEEWAHTSDRELRSAGLTTGASCHSIVRRLIQSGAGGKKIPALAKKLYLEQYDQPGRSTLEGRPAAAPATEEPTDYYTCVNGHSFKGFRNSPCPDCGSRKIFLEQYYVCDNGHSLRGLDFTPCPVCGSTATTMDEDLRVTPQELRRRKSEYNSIWRSACEEVDTAWKEKVSAWKDFAEGWEFRYIVRWATFFDQRMSELGYPADCTAIVRRLLNNLSQPPTQILDSWGGLEEWTQGPYVLESLERECSRAEGELRLLIPGLINIARGVYFELFIIRGPDSSGKNLTEAVPVPEHPTSPKELEEYRSRRAEDIERNAEVHVQRITAAQKRKNRADHLAAETQS